MRFLRYARYNDSQGLFQGQHAAGTRDLPSVTRLRPLFASLDSFCDFAHRKAFDPERPRWTVRHRNLGSRPTVSVSDTTKERRCLVRTVIFVVLKRILGRLSLGCVCIKGQIFSPTAQRLFVQRLSAQQHVSSLVYPLPPTLNNDHNDLPGSDTSCQD